MPRNMQFLWIYFHVTLLEFTVAEAVTWAVLYKKKFIKSSQYSQQNTCVGAFFNEKRRFIKGAFREYWKNFKNTFFTEYLRWRFLPLRSVVFCSSIHWNALSCSWALYRRRRPEVFRKKGILRNFAKLTGKHLCKSLFFNKDPRPATLLKKRLWHRCFPLNFVKFLRTSFFIEHFWWLLPSVLFKCRADQSKLGQWSLNFIW